MLLPIGRSLKQSRRRLRCLRKSHFLNIRFSRSPHGDLQSSAPTSQQGSKDMRNMIFRSTIVIAALMAMISPTLAQNTCPCTIWSANTAPVQADSGETAALELGIKFTSDTDGQVVGIRFYKSLANDGTHIGNLWSSTGTLLASATFSGETGS